MASPQLDPPRNGKDAETYVEGDDTSDVYITSDSRRQIGLTSAIFL
jgi:hypothetical protein